MRKLILNKTLDSSLLSSKEVSLKLCKTASTKVVVKYLSLNLTSCLQRNAESLKLMLRNAFKQIRRRKRERKLIRLEENCKSNKD